MDESLPPLAGTNPARSDAAWLAEATQPVAKRIWMVAGLGTLATVGTILFAAATARMAADVLFYGVPPEALAPLIGLAALCLLGRALAAGLAAQLAFGAGASLRRQVRAGVLDRLADRRSDSDIGEAATIAIEGVEALHDHAARYLPQRLLVVTAPLAILLALLPQDWMAALILLLTAPLIPLFMMLVGLRADAAARLHMAELQRLGAVFVDSLRGLGTLVLLGAAQGEAGRIAMLTDRWRQRTFLVLRIAFLSSAVLELFSALGVALVAVYVGFSLLDMLAIGPAGVGTLEAGLFALVLAPEFYMALRRLATHYHDRATALGAVPGLRQVSSANPVPDAEPVDLPRAPAPLTLKRLTKKFADGRIGLHPVSIELPATGLVALTGPSGVGKSTLLRLIAGLEAASGGEISLAGQMIDPARAAGWRDQLAWLPQRPRLLHGTALENLAPGGATPDRAALDWAALDWAALDWADPTGLIGELPDGLATRLGEDGAKLSGGQIQRLALARTLLCPAKIYLLDEPTAHLDAAREAQVIARLKAVAREALVIVAAHHPALAEAADRAVRLETPR